jgi:hypothetical protein
MADFRGFFKLQLAIASTTFGSLGQAVGKERYQSYDPAHKDGQYKVSNDQVLINGAHDDVIMMMMMVVDREGVWTKMITQVKIVIAFACLKRRKMDR